MGYRIEAPEKTYNGISASVSFRDGVGYTEIEYLADWFRKHGYVVTEEKKASRKEKG